MFIENKSSIALLLANVLFLAFSFNCAAAPAKKTVETNSVETNAAETNAAETNAAETNAAKANAAGASTQARHNLQPDKFDAYIDEVERNVALFNVNESDFAKLQEVIEAKPNDSFARFLLSKCYERKGMYDMAQEQFKIAEKLEVEPEQVLRRIRHHIESGELSQAFTMEYYVGKKAPDDPVITLLNGMFYQANGSSDNAEAIYRALLKRADCPLGTATALAAICIDRKNWTEASRLADRDLKLNPTYVSAVIAKSEALLAQGKAKQCFAVIEPAIKAHPFNRKLNLLLYRAYRHEGDHKSALRYALINLAVSDYISFFETAQSQVQRSLAVVGRKSSEPIVSEVSSLVERTTYKMKFHFYLSQVYFQLRWSREALEQVELALKLDPEFQPNWYQRGRIKETLLGDLPGALEDFKQAHKIERSDFKALRAYQRTRARVKNSKRDLALQIKNSLRNLSR